MGLQPSTVIPSALSPWKMSSPKSICQHQMASIGILYPLRMKTPNLGGIAFLPMIGSPGAVSTIQWRANGRLKFRAYKWCETTAQLGQREKMLFQRPKYENPIIVSLSRTGQRSSVCPNLPLCELMPRKKYAGLATQVDLGSWFLGSISISVVHRSLVSA